MMARHKNASSETLSKGARFSQKPLYFLAMGYYIRKLNKKKSLPHWKIQFVSYKNHRRTWDIPKER
jgi:hypothetical protein